MSDQTSSETSFEMNRSTTDSGNTLSGMEQLLLEISTLFINPQPDSIDITIQESLSKLAEFVMADRSYIFDYDFSRMVCINTFEWCREGINPQKNSLQAVPVSIIPDWVNTHKSGKELYIPDVATLPPGNLREILEPQEILSLLSVPMMLGNECTGFVGFDFVKKNHEYREKEKQLLRIFANMLVNILDRKKNELIIHQTRQNYVAFFNSIDDLLFVLNEEGVVIHINDPVRKRLGYSETELIGQSFLILHPPDKREEAGRIIGEMLTGKTDVCSIPVITKSGTKIPVETRITRGNWDGNPALFGVTKDMTLLKFSEEKFSKVFYLNPSACGLSDRNTHQYIEVNDAFTTLLGIEKKDALGKTPEELGIMTSETRNIVLQKVAECNRLTDIEATLMTKYGETKYVRLSAEILNLQDHSMLFTVVNDYTERKNAEIELIAAKEKAEESDRLKSAFLANMSHEIRTPMNGIMGFAQLLKKPELTGEEQAHYISIIERSGIRMLNIINDIIDISKIEAGLIQLHTGEVHINDLLSNLYLFFKPEAEAKGLMFSFVAGLRHPDDIIISDREKIYAILSNLIKNAIKYTHMGYIEFGYTAVSESGKKIIEFFVQDSGIGIPPDRLDAIFERFVQADIEDRDAYQGAGLGLAISKAYAEMMGGKIRVVSMENKGSEFFFKLPCKSEPDTTRKPENKDSKVIVSRKLKILLAEDDETSEILISIGLRNITKKLITTRNGNEIVEMVKNNSDSDLVIMDISMPGLNGYDATKKIRSFNKDIIIIAQTAYGLEGDRKKALDAGCNDYITKPLIIQDLIKLIGKYFPC